MIEYMIRLRVFFVFAMFGYYRTLDRDRLCKLYFSYYADIYSSILVLIDFLHFSTVVICFTLEFVKL